MRRRKTTVIALVIVVVTLCIIVALWQISRSRTFQFFGQLIPRVETSQKIVGLTFDDGPTPSGTNQGSNLGYAKGIKVWSSANGEWTTIDPKLVTRIIGRIHE